jgi:hypothetical protein
MVTQTGTVHLQPVRMIYFEQLILASLTGSATWLMHLAYFQVRRVISHIYPSIILPVTPFNGVLRPCSIGGRRTQTAEQQAFDAHQRER